MLEKYECVNFLIQFFNKLVLSPGSQIKVKNLKFENLLERNI